MSVVNAVSVRWTELLRSWASDAVVQPLIEPVLHPSLWRIRALAISTAVGHPLFYLIWSGPLSQPYESLALRLAMSALGLSLLMRIGVKARDPRHPSMLASAAIFWITLPVFFSWMYLNNHGNSVWLASMTAMFLIYYQLTDWRLATLGCISGIASAVGLFWLLRLDFSGLQRDEAAEHTVIMGFSWFMGFVLGVSSSNLRREQLNNTLATMGIMAHELRTPLATMALIGDAVRAEAKTHNDPPRLEHLTVRLHILVRNMHHQIDTQIANARLMRLPRHKETISAGELVNNVIAEYPFRSSRERERVTVVVRRDFRFEGSRTLFSQVLDNLIKNALRSLACASTACQPGDLSIQVNTSHNRGYIVIADRGIGIEKAFQAQIFEPFFSTNHQTGHGLGLAFCQRVIESARGTIRVNSELLQGAVFTIELPLQR